MPFTPRRPRSGTSLLMWPFAVALSLLLVVGAAPTARAAPIEDYASWQGGTTCRPKDKPGTVFLAGWMVKRFGGVRGGIGRACSPSTSEHEEGRAFDWGLDATKKRDRKRARLFMAKIFASDRPGNAHAKARRMGVMYVIWNDRMWSAWDAFEPEPYLSAGCKSEKKCSKTLRHRDHLHVSLTRRAGRGATSWFVNNMPSPGSGT